MWPVESEICLEILNPDICWILNFTKLGDFQSLEVVDRTSESQIQETDNLNFLARSSKA